MFEARARSFLSSHGYQLRFRHTEWIECLVLRGSEGYLGHGADRETALRAALEAAFSTPLARLAMAQVLEQTSAEDTPTDPPPPPEELLSRIHAAPSGLPAHDDSARPDPIRAAGQIAVIVSRPRPGNGHLALTTPPGPLQPVPVPVPVQPVPVQPVHFAMPSIIPGVNAPTVPPVSAFSVPSAAGASGAAGQGVHAAISAGVSTSIAPGDADPRVFGDVERSLDALDVLMDRIRDAREELGLSSPERQRLAMLCWICEARSHADAFPEDVRVRDRVGAISRQLTDFGKTFWPGSVTALQLHMQPRDLPRHLIGGTATSWYRAAELAEAALRAKELEDERKGYDGYGYADAKMLTPRPAQAARLMLELVAEVEALSGRLSTYAQPAESSVRPEPDTFLRWVRTLRWLRGSDVDLDAWARVAGRLRWWAFRRDPQITSPSRELEASYSPQQPWAQLLAQDAEFKRVGLRMLGQIERTPRLDPLEPRKQLLDWLVRVLPFGGRFHGNLVNAVQPYRTLVLSLTVEELPELHRRLEPELRALQGSLHGGLVGVAMEPVPATERELDATLFHGDPADELALMPSALLERVRELTGGKRAVFVSNRRDPDLQASLQDAFRFASVDCRIAESKRAQALGEAIEGHQFDFVLSAIGFQLQGLDQALSRACRAAGVTYLRVNRGQPLACLRALARELATRT